MDKIASEIAKKIKARRKELKLTADQVGFEIGLKRSTFSNIENGNQHVYAHTLWQISKALRCKSITELFPDDEFEKIRKMDDKSAKKSWLKQVKSL